MSSAEFSSDRQNQQSGRVRAKPATPRDEIHLPDLYQHVRTGLSLAESQFLLRLATFDKDGSITATMMRCLDIPAYRAVFRTFIENGEAIKRPPVNTAYSVACVLAISPDPAALRVEHLEVIALHKRLRETMPFGSLNSLASELGDFIDGGANARLFQLAVSSIEVVLKFSKASADQTATFADQLCSILTPLTSCVCSEEQLSFIDELLTALIKRNKLTEAPQALAGVASLVRRCAHEVTPAVNASRWNFAKPYIERAGLNMPLLAALSGVCQEAVTWAGVKRPHVVPEEGHLMLSLCFECVDRAQNAANFESHSEVVAEALRSVVRANLSQSSFRWLLRVVQPHSKVLTPNTLSRFIHSGLICLRALGEIKDVRLRDEAILSIEAQLTLNRGVENICNRLELFARLLGNNPTPSVLQACSIFFNLATGTETVEQLNEVVAALRDLARPAAPPYLIRHFIEQAKEVANLQWTTATALVRRAAAHAAAYGLRAATTEHEADDLLSSLALHTGVPLSNFTLPKDSHQKYREEQSQFWHPLASEYESLQRRLERDQGKRTAQSLPSNPVLDRLIPPARQAYLAWSRVANGAHGFGSLLYPTRKTPDGETPYLMRFAADCGEVGILNARDSEHFPGRGFLVRKLDPTRVLVADPRISARDGGPLRPYKEAWPGYAEAIDDISRAEFIFSRGMMIISCPNRDKDEKYNIHLSDFPWEQVSLGLHNVHFKNPGLELSSAIPTKNLKERFKKSLIHPNNYRGFDIRHRDLNMAIPNVEALGLEGSPLLMCGSPQVITSGIVGDGHRAWARLFSELGEHDDKVKESDRAFRAARAAGVGTMSLDFRRLEVVERRLRADAMNLLAEQVRLSNVAQFEEAKVWEVVHRLMNLFDVFRILMAYYGRGYFQPRSSDDRQQENDESQAPYFATDGEEFFNPGASVMLKELYRWHSLHDLGVTDREQFPVAVIGNALDSAGVRDTSVVADSYDMSVTIDGQKVALTQDEMTFDDEIFWQTRVLPRAQDTEGIIPDIRLLPRQSLNGL